MVNKHLDRVGSMLVLDQFRKLSKYLLQDLQSLHGSAPSNQLLNHIVTIFVLDQLDEVWLDVFNHNLDLF